MTSQRNLVKELMATSANLLKTSMFVSTVCYGFPVKTIMTFMYARKTYTEYKFKMEDLFDFVICAMITLWLQTYFSYRNREAENPKIASTKDEIFMYELIVANNNKTFNFDVLVALIAAAFWLRMFLMLKLTRTFGPMIRIIYVMVQDLGIFLVLWGIQLFIFSCIGTLVFSDIPEYNNFFNVLIMLTQSALG